MLLDAGRLAAPQNAEQLVIGDEEKAWEGVAFGVQVIVQALLAALQTFTQVPQVRQAIRYQATPLNTRVLHCFRHDL